MSPGWNRPGVVVHQNQRRLGCYPNWLQMAKWLVEETECPFLLLLEDDGLFCRGAAPGLYYGLTHLDGIGCISLYTPHHNYQLHAQARHSRSDAAGRTQRPRVIGPAEGPDSPGNPELRGNKDLNRPIQQTSLRAPRSVESDRGWMSLDTTDRWGTVAQCFPRPVIQRFLQQADGSKLEGTDRYLDQYLGANRLRWYSHVPSLVDHIGISSTLGHVSGRENAGVDFRADFVGYRQIETGPGSSPPESRKAPVRERRPASSVPSNLKRESGSTSTPLVSIVLPAYNGEKYLRESIDSCLKQSFQDWELIIVDDGSTDGTDRVIRSFRDPRILSVRHSVNRRLPAALNTGFRISRGELLTWTSCDNRYGSQALETLVDFLKQNSSTDMVYTDLRMIDESGTAVRHHLTGPTENLAEWNVVGACFLYRREIYEAIGDYSEECFLAEDYDYWLRASQRFRLTHLPITLYDYRLHSDSLTSKFSDQIPTVTRDVKSRHAVHGIALG